MKNKNNDHNLTNFWFSFALGISGGILLSYLFGTKKGRKILKKLVEVGEDLEVKGIDFIYEIEKEFTTKSDLTKDSSEIKPLSALNNIIDKIKSVSLQKR